MDWFNILKNPELVQGQRQGMKPIDIQKPFKRVKENDCFNKLIAFVESRFEFEFKHSYDSPMGKLDEYQYHKNYFTSPNENMPEYLFLRFYANIPDDVYCTVLKVLEFFISHSLKIDWTEDIMPPPGPSMPSIPNLRVRHNVSDDNEEVTYFIDYSGKENFPNSGLLVTYHVYKPDFQTKLRRGWNSQ
jgi:hypothetical protein|tara:strand:+ start:129 stop:692 length:564 start_codon:yes stop_codon:yes gene_type:complete